MIGFLMIISVNLYVLYVLNSLKEKFFIFILKLLKKKKY